MENNPNPNPKTLGVHLPDVEKKLARGTLCTRLVNGGNLFMSERSCNRWESIWNNDGKLGYTDEGR